MIKIFGILLLSFLFTGLLSIPFINLLYKLKFQRQEEHSKDILGKDTPIFARLHGWKIGTPNGGGILVIGSVLLFSFIFYKVTKFNFNSTSSILYLTIILFGALGFYDDIQKIFGWKKTGFWGLKIRFKLLIQIVFALIISSLIYLKMGISSLIIPLPQLNFLAYDSMVNWQGLVVNLGVFYIFFATFVIVGATNAFNITDGLDGLATGLLLVALSAFWYLAGLQNHGDVILFMAVLTGSLLAFMYFNIFPARIWLGDTGAMAFGALLAVIALVTQSVAVLPIIGGVFVVEAMSTLIQWYSKALRGKKIFLCAPLHHHFEAKGWDETKVTMRFWLAGAVLAFIGIFIALLPSLKF
ncbi:phospho-N-acetylmuramoyl-pentapeptide-transferase [candidate division WWE3 bacterium CG06_land_8_20_14_3_00_42_16]|uniref:Phospho-N-acetylmuramoyl-pentapeptide-transferase n=3 Tax=Katanobacteria TaxID=422282 RepID=A0A2M7AL91_UNCKA|nr:MAG: phospho-N-acetylmuramoyl-pentapeptide-transferase [candidate division WWE3 bacterium CG06_land_8_20_14_3_00_42_16]PIZ43589.1 MAG: phospho-N-acetylmuramoyl-pentapeptide-transferase [candidate division WWE3 bacterium CG_4_10_14_0_2_um_filter_42_8]PJA38409.1 MAG: phospho-N-acetylmuramoyl-pentapeptide-transferase [candidate division WWE3 bacterium CG_4_9_14_3_um_filter_43_9]